MKFSPVVIRCRVDEVFNRKTGLARTVDSESGQEFVVGAGGISPTELVVFHDPRERLAGRLRRPVDENSEVTGVNPTTPVVSSDFEVVVLPLHVDRKSYFGSICWRRDDYSFVLREVETTCAAPPKRDQSAYERDRRKRRSGTRGSVPAQTGISPVSCLNFLAPASQSPRRIAPAPSCREVVVRIR